MSRRLGLQTGGGERVVTLTARHSLSLPIFEDWEGSRESWEISRVEFVTDVDWRLLSLVKILNCQITKHSRQLLFLISKWITENWMYNEGGASEWNLISFTMTFFSPFFYTLNGNNYVFLESGQSWYWETHDKRSSPDISWSTIIISSPSCHRQSHQTGETDRYTE